MDPGEYVPNIRLPFNMQAPGPWALRSPRPRAVERRGPGRPRLNASTSKSGDPNLDFSMGRRLNTFYPGPGDGSTPSPSLETVPGSPSLVGQVEDEFGQKRSQHPDVPDLQPQTPEPGKTSKGNKKRFICEVCQKRFSTAWYVRVHRKSHNGERPYTCDSCGKGFMLPNVLLTHKKKCERSQTAAAAALNPTASNEPPIQPQVGIKSESSTSSPPPQNIFLSNSDDLHPSGAFPQEGSHYTPRYPPVHLNYHPHEHQIYGARDFLGGNGVQGYTQQPISPQFQTYPPTPMGGVENPAVATPTSSPHFLANDKPQNKGGGCGGSLEGGELPPSNKNTPLTPESGDPCDFCSKKCNLVTHIGERPTFTHLDAHQRTHRSINTIFNYLRGQEDLRMSSISTSENPTNFLDTCYNHHNFWQNHLWQHEKKLISL